MQKKAVWLDCDPGHDDAFAMILAGHNTGLILLGISTVFGNQTVEKTTTNALKVSYASGLSHVGVVKGSGSPLMRARAICPEVHGDTGLDSFSGIQFPELPIETLPANAIVHMSQAIMTCVQPVTLICTAALTNIALLLKVFPEVKEHILEVIVLGGSVGAGNIGPVTEWNMMIDPEATRIVFESHLRLVQIPLEVTHKALVTPDVLARFVILDSKFSKLFVDLLLFFTKTYKEVFGFDSPPLHDPLAVAAAIDSSLFEFQHVHVDIETQSEFSSGQTMCDLYGITNRPKNVFLATNLNVNSFWNLMVESFLAANEISPLNCDSH